MFKIGEIYVPKDFFDKLKDEFIGNYAAEILSEAGDSLPDDLREKLQELETQQWQYPGLYSYLTALIRVQTEDYTRHDVDIEASEDRNKITREAGRQAGIELAEILPVDHALIASVTGELGKNLSTGRGE